MARLEVGVEEVGLEVKWKELKEPNPMKLRAINESNLPSKAQSAITPIQPSFAIKLGRKVEEHMSSSTGTYRITRLLTNKELIHVACSNDRNESEIPHLVITN
ncbi:hypothetical protein KIN20_003709 [Parelaphostrongylus tenuis]|uniref:Uncharacterized protein n=1 Tax=Parelaphostrongylus tenuis TaxID=148309 RepID=A0AAD5M0N0_PARTN|nr:hypothetical protein KIN20_003709 [Parelaphostrongylus tenuis]